MKETGELRWPRAVREGQGPDGAVQPRAAGPGFPLCTRFPAPTCRSTPGSLIYMICLTALGLELEVKFVIPVVILKYVYNTPENNKMCINCISVKKERK